MNATKADKIEALAGWLRPDAIARILKCRPAYVRAALSRKDKKRKKKS